nr:retrotransposon protein, putative, unclassified, expressed [Tanacetum cinerariifolium]
MSSMGELTLLLGLQVKQKKDGIFIRQDKYVAKILRKFGLNEGKSASTPIDTEKPLLKDPNGEDCKKQTVVATSSTEAEYVAAASCCAQLILLVERRYPLSRFTLDQMLNAVRLRVEEQSEMSLELLRFTRQQHQEGQLE